MLENLARTVSRRPRGVVALSCLVFLALTAVAAGVVDALSLNRYEAPGSESLAAREALAASGRGSPNVAVLVEPAAGDPARIDDPAVATAARDLARGLEAVPGVGDVWSAWEDGAPDTLASDDRTAGLVLAWAPGDADQVRGTVLPAIEERVLAAVPQDGPVTATLGGGDQVFRVVADQARTDFLRAELVVIPLVGLLLWAVYRRLGVALVTLATGVLAVVGTLAALRGMAAVTEISTFASNIALVMGIGLGVDYGLFMVYRFREELTAGVDVRGAVRQAVRVAGRTIAFSGLTVGAALAVLLVFPFPFLSSFAYAGIAVVLSALLASLVFLPAALTLLGRRVLSRGAPPDGAFWRRTVERVTARPLAWGGAGLAVLVLLGAPALGVSFGAPDDRVLPTGSPVRAMYDTIRADFRTEEADALQVVLPDADAADDESVAAFAARLSGLPGVERVDSAVGSSAGGEAAVPSGADAASRFALADGGTWLSVLPTGQTLADDPTGLVATVRATAPPPALGAALVGGYPADLTDYRDGVAERLPLVAALVVVVTLLVLFAMTGSVVVPAIAGLLNVLSLAVMFGVLVAGFQDGLLSGILGFEATGTIEPSIPLLMFCIAYGLSMDYQVFLLSRVQEDYLRTGDALGAVPRGVGRSAPLVTAAAVILAASFAVYATSGITFLQQLGIGMAVAVLVDATVVRGVLLPAALSLAGDVAWWSPAPLRRLARRWRLGEAGPPADERVPVPDLVGGRA
ncbi:MMPL family transporter [Krasilnikoviella flava]|uniref:Putative drug exporter of the RND superfamily n=1 Tax=Krasilnikoviella flava TaxID=526729 RepID=A0A1T5I6L6_9MICO|nr:MMPL family transporter [Krasilnikoviella flava]SKC34769.1 putative drug exporter of the RND superfamily [Krasilnikoviella flava]